MTPLHEPPDKRTEIKVGLLSEYVDPGHSFANFPVNGPFRERLSKQHRGRSEVTEAWTYKRR